MTGADAVRIETGIAHKWDRGEEDQRACLYEPLTLPHGEQVRLEAEVGPRGGRLRPLEALRGPYDPFASTRRSLAPWRR